MKSLSFQGISVLKTVFWYISSRKLLEAAAFLRPGVYVGLFAWLLWISVKGRTCYLVLRDCWTWLSNMDGICGLKNLVIVCYFFQLVEIHRNEISLLKEGSCFVWVGVCGDIGLDFTVVLYVTILAWSFFSPPCCGLICSIFFPRLASLFNGWYQNFVWTFVYFHHHPPPPLLYSFICSNRTCCGVTKKWCLLSSMQLILHVCMGLVQLTRACHL